MNQDQRILTFANPDFDQLEGAFQTDGFVLTGFRHLPIHERYQLEEHGLCFLNAPVENPVHGQNEVLMVRHISIVCLMSLLTPDSKPPVAGSSNRDTAVNSSSALSSSASDRGVREQENGLLQSVRTHPRRSYHIGVLADESA